MELIARVEQLHEIITSVLPHIQQMDDARLLQTAINAEYLERFAFLVRGACAAELRRRIPTRLAGGRGKQDKDGSGIGSHLARLAKDIGVSAKTLDTDVRIYQVFFSRGETVLADEHCLRREYYVAALGAPDPLGAIEVAKSKSAEPGYNVQQFRAFVRDLKRNGPADKAASEQESDRWLRVKIPQEAHQTLNDLVQRTGRAKEIVVAEAIIALHLALTGTGAKGSVARAKHRADSDSGTRDNGQLRLQMD